jgi:hypothetical protein
MITTTETTHQGELIKHFDAKRGWWELLRLFTDKWGNRCFTAL